MAGWVYHTAVSTAENRRPSIFVNAQAAPIISPHVLPAPSYSVQPQPCAWRGIALLGHGLSLRPALFYAPLLSFVLNGCVKHPVTSYA